MRLLNIVLAVLISSSLVANYSDSAVAATDSKSSKSSSHRGHNSHGRSKGKKRLAKTGSGNVWERIRLGIRIPRPGPASTVFEQIAASRNKNLAAPSSGFINTTDAAHAHYGESARLTTIIAPKKLPMRGSQVLIPHKESQIKPSLSSADKYTRLGRLKFGSKEPSTSLAYRFNKAHITSNKRLYLAKKGDSLFKSSSVQRIRTRLGLHPEFFKGGDVAVAETDGENSSSDKKTGLGSKAKVQQQVGIRNCSDLNKKDVINIARQGLLPESFAQMAEQCLIKQNENYARVGKHIAGYSQRKGVLYQVSERARPYLHYIVDALSKHNLPLDLALLPIVESAYQPTALSPKSAAGIWQFIPSTAMEYGLEQNGDYDARLDITASTNAAIRFLSGLNYHFKGDWLLTLAAYNCGQGAVDTAISRNLAEGLDTDFWSLALPAETQEYVPRLLALSSIFESPDSYGLKLRPVINEPYFIKVTIDRETDINHLVQKDLKTIAKLADFDSDQFSLLNSAYLKSAITKSRPFTLLMPISNANLLHKSLAFMTQSYKDEKKTAPIFPESALFSEGSGSKTQAPLLALDLGEDQQWFPPELRVATFGVKAASTADDNTTRIKTLGEDYLAVHYLDKGESLKAVAENHGISEEMLRTANKFKRRQSIPLGQRLLIPPKQMAVATPIKKTRVSVLFQGMVDDFDPLRSRL
jgi:soluble lytic murein transglycosylase-like protein/LysM repeat protein